MIRTLLLALALASTVTACGKKKAPAAPANAAPDSGAAPGGAPSDSDSDIKDESKPDDPDDAQKMGADPCDGGE